MLESFNRSLKVKAEKFIEEIWIQLAVKDVEAKLSDCFPSDEVINNLEETVKSLGLSEYDLAIMIVDVGFNELEERAERFKLSLKQISAGSDSKSVLEAAAFTMATHR